MIQQYYNKDVALAELLTTKLAPPRLHSPVVSRETLLAMLNAGLHRKLTLVSAPAGFGKSTLVSEWIANLPVPAAWVALDEGDNDPVRFWRYIVGASQAFHPDMTTSAFAMLHSSQQYPLDAVLTTFMNDLTLLSNKCVLVLEDYHVITSPRLHEAMTFLLDHLPKTLHIVIITRDDPLLPLARLRAHDELNELRAIDLRFSHEEIQKFLQQTLPFLVPTAIVTGLEQRTEGWIVGLRIAALSLQRRRPEEVENFLANFTGGHHHILDYLVTEVFAAQPEEIQDFLLKTSFLSRLSGSLCNAVTGRNDGDLFLQRLEQANLFLIPFDDTHEWYRYHALFAETMKLYANRHLSEHDLCELHHRASVWYETHGILAEAVEMSLAAQTYVHVVDLLERMIDPGLMKINGEYYTLRRWISRIPEDVLSTHPALCLNYALAILFTSNRHAAATMELLKLPIQMAEQCWIAEGNSDKLGEVLALRTLVEYWQGNFARSFSTAKQALDLLPENQTEWRGIMLLHVGTGEWFDGNSEVARRIIQDGQPLSEAAGNEFAKRDTLRLLAEISLCQGQPYEAERLFQEMLNQSSKDIRSRAHALIGLSTLSFENNDLDTAERYAIEANAIAEEQSDKFILADTMILLARLKQARGDSASAQQMLYSQAVSISVPFYTRKLRAWHAWIALMAGDLTTVQGWYTTYAQNEDNVSVLQLEQEAIIAARLLIVRNETEKALDLLNHWQESAQAGKRARSELEIMIVKASAYFVDKHLQEAKTVIISALTFAHKVGYMRLFLQEGQAMTALLKEVSVAEDLALASYVHALLRAVENEQARNEVASYLALLTVKDSLSPQEQRVLRLLADGLSMPEIADELVVSINTIKTQVKSIYRKLNVTSRKEARKLASQLNLL